MPAARNDGIWKLRARSTIRSTLPREGVKRHGQDRHRFRGICEEIRDEKDSPYTRWVRSEGLDMIAAHYVPNLHTVGLKPWARRGGNGVFINHEASRTSND